MPLDINMVVLCGILAIEAERVRLDGGLRCIHYLVVVRTEAPSRRVDVIPAVLRDPPHNLWQDPGERDDPVWLVGALQRRLADMPDEGVSRLEVVAEQVVIRDLGERWPVTL